jgi:hypothetical protein
MFSSEILHANIFFFIATVGVVVLSLLAAIALFYIVKILRAVSRITERIERGSETVVEDVKRLRAYVAEGSLISQIVGLFMRTSRGRSDDD